MYVCEGLRLNKFREVAIPANREYFSKFGYLSAERMQFSGDDVAPVNKNKVDTLADMDDYDKMMQQEENDKI